MNVTKTNRVTIFIVLGLHGDSEEGFSIFLDVLGTPSIIDSILSVYIKRNLNILFVLNEN